jgi:feruloyl esterase
MSSADPQAACAGLAGMQIAASAIGLPTSGATVQSATLVIGEATNGEYCAVKGSIAPVQASSQPMEFQVNLPTRWNGKALQMGGGGYDGVLVTGTGTFTAQAIGTPNALARGYVTLGSDGGHKGNGPFDGRFALDDEALLNYGQQSVKKAHDVAAQIIRRRYAASPRRFYFIGGSQGGHEALDAAARYAADYDGVIANYPAYNVTLLQQASLNVGKALYANGGAGWINPAKKKLLIDAVYAACDELDGLADGTIGNVRGCNAAFNIDTVKARLRCPGGQDAGDNCLSDAQIQAVQRIGSPFDLGFPVAGQQVFPRWPVLEGAVWARSSFGAAAQPANPPAPSDALLYAIGAAHVKFLVTKDPAYDALRFDPAAWRSRLQQLGTLTDVANVSLSAFRDRGGKLILTHGTADDLISPHNSESYYDIQIAAFGQPAVDAFVRFYEIPGYGHGAGPYNLGYDGLGVLDAWVDQGRAPETIPSRDNNPGATRTRPMCRWPTWPRYTGGNADEAASFRCVGS